MFSMELNERVRYHSFVALFISLGLYTRSCGFITTGGETIAFKQSRATPEFAWRKLAVRGNFNIETGVDQDDQEQ